MLLPLCIKFFQVRVLSVCLFLCLSFTKVNVDCTVLYTFFKYLFLSHKINGVLYPAPCDSFTQRTDTAGTVISQSLCFCLSLCLSVSLCLSLCHSHSLSLSCACVRWSNSERYGRYRDNVEACGDQKGVMWADSGVLKMRRAEQKITLYLTKGEHEESQQGKALQPKRNREFWRL